VAAIGTGGLIRRWDVATGKELRIAGDSPEGELLGMAYSPDGKRLAAACSDGIVHVWDMATLRHIHSLAGPAAAESQPRNQGFSVAFTPDGRSLVTGWLSGALQTWNVETGKEIHRLQGHSSVVASLAVSPDGRRLASADWSGNIFWWNLAEGKQLKQLAGVDATYSGPQKLAIAPGGRLLAAVSRSGPFKRIRIWELSTGELRHQFTARAPVQALNESDEAFADGYYLSRGGYGAVNGTVYSDFDPFTGVAFSPDGKQLAWTAGTFVHIWDPLRGREQRQ
jgi:WD40 repeat protein